MKNIVIFGAAESASLARHYLERDGARKVVAFVVDDEYLREDTAHGLPVAPFSEMTTRFPPAEYDAHVAVAWGRANSIRQRKYDACKAAGYTLASVVSEKASVFPDLVYGENTLVLEQSAVQPAVRLGNDVLVGTGVGVGHASVIADHVSLSSNVALGGSCRLGLRVYFGLCAVARDHCTIGDDAIVTMAAAVTRDLPAGAVLLAPTSTIADPETAEIVRQNSFPDPG